MIPDPTNWGGRIVQDVPWIVATLGVALYLSSWLDAKLGADLQARVGPNRAGRAGFLQPMANAIRLISRSTAAAAGSRAWWLPRLPLFAMLATIPAGAGGPLLQAPLAIFAPVFLGIGFAWLGLLAAWRTEEVAGRLASIRRAAVALAAVVPAVPAIAIAGMGAGGFSWAAVEQAQGFLPTRWLLFSSPFTLVGGIVFLACGILLFSLPAFGMEEARCRFSRRMASACWALIGVEIFLGGSRLPEWVESFIESGWALAAVHSVVLVVKLVVLDVGLSIAARTLPRARTDQAHEFAWRVIGPVAIFSLIGQRIFLAFFPGGVP